MDSKRFFFFRSSIGIRAWRLLLCRCLPSSEQAGVSSDHFILVGWVIQGILLPSDISKDYNEPVYGSRLTNLYLYIYHRNQLNVGKYIIHGEHG